MTPSEEQDFTEFVRAHGDRLLRFARLLVPDAAEARPDLARMVLDRARRRRRVRRLRNAAVGAGGGIVVLTTLAAAAVLGRSEFVTITQPTTAMGSTVRVGERVVLNKKLSPVRGDNRAAASDSRYIGPVDRDDVTGVAVQIKDPAGKVRAVPGAPARGLPGDQDNVDPAGPVPPAAVADAVD